MDGDTTGLFGETIGGDGMENDDTCGDGANDFGMRGNVSAGTLGYDESTGGNSSRTNSFFGDDRADTDICDLSRAFINGTMYLGWLTNGSVTIVDVGTAVDEMCRGTDGSGKVNGGESSNFVIGDDKVVINLLEFL